MFDENEISDTVVEFKVTSNTVLSKKNVTFGGLLIIIFVWSLVAKSYACQLVAALALLSFLIFLKYNVREESITIINNFGVQLRVRYLFGNEKVEFFDNDRINNVFIHEYFYGSQHVYPGFDKMKRVYAACKQTSR